MNSSLIRGTENFVNISNISVASFHRFFTYIETVHFFPERFLKDELKSLYTIRKTLSCKQLILLLIERLWNIQTRRQ